MSYDLTTARPGSVWDFMSDVERALDEAWRIPATRKDSRDATGFTPAVDVHETDDAYLLSLDLPGIPQKNIKIEASDGRLTISGERTQMNTENKEQFKRVERSFGRFERSFQLPQNVDQAKIEARYEHGVLEVVVPKSAVAKPRQIQIQAKGDSH